MDSLEIDQLYKDLEKQLGPRSAHIYDAFLETTLSVHDVDDEVVIDTVRLCPNQCPSKSDGPRKPQTFIHAVVGTTSRLILAFRLAPPGAGASSARNFLPLLAMVNDQFKAKRVIADKAFFSMANIVGALKLEITPYIPTKYFVQLDGLTPDMASLYMASLRKMWLSVYGRRIIAQPAFSAIQRSISRRPAHILEAILLYNLRTLGFTRLLNADNVQLWLDALGTRERRVS